MSVRYGCPVFVLKKHLSDMNGVNFLHYKVFGFEFKMSLSYLIEVRLGFPCACLLWVWGGELYMHTYTDVVRTCI